MEVAVRDARRCVVGAIGRAHGCGSWLTLRCLLVLVAMLNKPLLLVHRALGMLPMLVLANLHLGIKIRRMLRVGIGRGGVQTLL